MSMIVSKCKFSTDEDKISSYAASTVAMDEQLAYMQNLTLNEYIQKNGMTEDEYYNISYKMAEEKVKRILVIGYLAEQWGIDEPISEGGLPEVYEKIERKVVSRFGIVLE